VQAGIAVAGVVLVLVVGFSVGQHGMQPAPSCGDHDAANIAQVRRLLADGESSYTQRMADAAGASHDHVLAGICHGSLADGHRLPRETAALSR
jgi:hypothetical protein